VSFRPSRMAVGFESRLLHPCDHFTVEEEEVDCLVSVVLIAPSHPAESILLVFMTRPRTPFTMVFNFAASVLQSKAVTQYFAQCRRLHSPPR